MKTSSAKGKGRKLQQHVALKIREKFDLPEDDVVSRPMGSSGEDIMMSDRARKTLPLSIECKNTKSFPSLAALRQSDHNSGEHTPAACWKPHGKSYEDTIIYMTLNEFLELWNSRSKLEDPSP